MTTPPSTERFTFRKSERISSKKLFDLLFEKGAHFRSGPFKFIYLSPLPAELAQAPLMVGMLVPSRTFRKAVDRNYLRRRMREAWRLEKNQLTTALVERGTSLAVLVRLDTRKMLSSSEIRPAIRQGLQKLEALLP